jgi:hypothetical protein
MKQSQIKFNIGSLNNLRAELAAGYKAKVGVIGSKAVRASDTGGFNNAEIGIVHEMGSQFLGIPARSFLRMPLEMKRKELVMFARKNGALIEQGKVKEFFALIGIKAEQIIQSAFETRGFGQWAANSPTTIAKKGSSAPLIDTGELRKSISSEVMNAS